MQIDEEEPPCKHPNKVDSERDGDCVCTDCGLVLEQLLLPFPSFTEHQEPGNREMHEFMADHFARLEVPDNANRYAVKYFNKIHPLLKTKFSKETIASYAMYEALITFAMPLLAEEVERITGISRKRIWRIESHLAPTGENVHNPQHFVARYCTLLGLSYPEQLLIEEAVECLNCATEIPLGNLHCNCLVGVVLYLFCKAGKAKREIPLDEICATCLISATSVHRVIRQMRRFLPELEEEEGSHLTWIVDYLNATHH